MVNARRVARQLAYDIIRRYGGHQAVDMARVAEAVYGLYTRYQNLGYMNFNQIRVAITGTISSNLGNFITGGDIKRHKSNAVISANLGIVIGKNHFKKPGMFFDGQPIIKFKDVLLKKCHKGPDRWDENSVIFTKHYVRQGARVIGSQINKKRFATLGNFTLDQQLSDANGVKSIINILDYPEDHMNSVAQMITVANDMVNAVQDNTWTDGATQIRKNFSYPSYNATPPYVVDQINDGNLLLGMSKQHLNFRLKNLTKNEVPPDTGVFTTTPITGKIYVFQLKEDIHQLYYQSIAGGKQNGLSTYITRGFKTYYDFNQGSEELPSSFNQDPHVNIMENTWIKDYCTMRHVQPFALLPGQELQINYKIPYKQIFSYQFLGRANLADIAGTSGIYQPVICKKGECFWYIEFIGGLNGDANSANPIPNPKKPSIEQGQLAIYNTLQWDASLMSWSGGKKKLNFQTETLSTALVPEIDHDLQ